MGKKNNIIAGVLLILSALFLLGGLFFWLREKGVFTIPDKAKVVEASFEASVEPIPENQKTEKEEPVASVEVSEPEPVPEPEPEPEPVLVENPYKDYYLENKDMVGWLKIEDTIVDFPVMWTPGDENYYLLKGFDKKYSGNGCLILDTDSSLDPLSTNLIIHGHNNPHAMFGELDKYEDKKYRDEHPYIHLYAKDYDHVYEVIAAFRSKVFYKSDVCFKYYKFFNATNEAEFKDFYANIMALSYYDTGAEVNYGDHFLTLSTCSYHVENGRFVVVAREIEPGDYYESFE